MKSPQPLNVIFRDKLFRIPDYQRGYAWQREQLVAFWDDLVNLPAERSHYTGVLTLKQALPSEIKEDSKEHWLVEENSYKLFHVVDGQQRLTTVVIFMQCFAEFLRSLPANESRSDDEIFVSKTLILSAVTGKFLFREPPGKPFRTYLFGYTTDNPSNQFMRHRILGELGDGSIQQTFYTLNLANAKKFFRDQFIQLHEDYGLDGVAEIYRTLTKRFLFNEYIIEDEFDVFVAFETMNNRGKQLSHLELLKNRLIYLTTLYSDDEVSEAHRADLRDQINGAWKEVYFQLGRNQRRTLGDNEFLKAHWTIFFKYTRKTGSDYIRFLLDDQFSPRNIHRKVPVEVELEEDDEPIIDEETGEEIEPADDESVTAEQPKLHPDDIRDYVQSLRQTAVHWFHSHYPDRANELSDEEREWLRKLNRLGIAYFRPLVTAILKVDFSASQRVELFQAIERYIFVMFRLSQYRSNFGSSVFSRAARGIDRGELTPAELLAKLKDSMQYIFEDDGVYRSGDIDAHLQKLFDKGDGYYGWSGLRYFLYEYELDLLESSSQKKV